MQVTFSSATIDSFYEYTLRRILQPNHDRQVHISVTSAHSIRLNNSVAAVAIAASEKAVLASIGVAPCDAKWHIMHESQPQCLYYVQSDCCIDSRQSSIIRTSSERAIEVELYDNSGTPGALYGHKGMATAVGEKLSAGANILGGGSGNLSARCAAGQHDCALTKVH